VQGEVPNPLNPPTGCAFHPRCPHANARCSKIVVNKQPPLQEIWLAARAGGFHFKWDGAVWRDTKTGAEFVALFNEQASRQARKTLVLE
jgi:iron donor protein CyaY